MLTSARSNTGPTGNAMHEKTIIALDTKDGVAIGRITCPSVGEREAPIIQQEGLQSAGNVGHRLILDFSQVNMMGSLALGTLVTISKQCKAGGGKLALFGLNKNLSDVLKMSRLDKLLTIAKDEDHAIRKVS